MMQDILPYVAMALKLSEKAVDYQLVADFAASTATALRTHQPLPFDSNHALTVELKKALQAVIHHFSDDKSDNASIFVYLDIPLEERNSSPQFVAMIQDARDVLLKNTALTKFNRITVLTVFQLLSQSSSTNGFFGTAEQIKACRSRALECYCEPLRVKRGLAPINEHVERQRPILLAKLRARKKELDDQLAELNRLAEKAYQEIDDQYDELLASVTKKITHEFRKIEKRAIKKAAKNFEKVIAVMVTTACFAPYLSGLLGELVCGAAVGETSLMLDAIAASMVSTTTQSVLSNNYKGFHENLAKGIALNYANASIACEFAGAKNAARVANNTVEAMELSAATEAIKSILQAAIDGSDIGEAAVLGALNGAAGERIELVVKTDLRKLFGTERTAQVFEEVMKAGAKGATQTLWHKDFYNFGAIIVNAAESFLACYIADSLCEAIEPSEEYAAGACNSEDLETTDVVSQVSAEAPPADAELDQPVMQSTSETVPTPTPKARSPQFFQPNTNTSTSSGTAAPASTTTAGEPIVMFEGSAKISIGGKETATRTINSKNGQQLVQDINNGSRFVAKGNETTKDSAPRVGLTGHGLLLRDDITQIELVDNQAVRVRGSGILESRSDGFGASGFLNVELKRGVRLFGFRPPVDNVDYEANLDVSTSQRSASVKFSAQGHGPNRIIDVANKEAGARVDLPAGISATLKAKVGFGKMGIIPLQSFLFSLDADPLKLEIDSKKCHYKELRTNTATFKLSAGVDISIDKSHTKNKTTGVGALIKNMRRGIFLQAEPGYRVTHTPNHPDCSMNKLPAVDRTTSFAFKNGLSQ